MFHSGSTDLAQQLNRFRRAVALDVRRDHELVVGEAARLGVQTPTLQQYLDWYGEEPVTIRQRGAITHVPAYEAALRRDVLGERLSLLAC